MSVRGLKVEKLVDVWPELVAELTESLTAGGRSDLAEQLTQASITRATYDSSCNAAYIYLRPPRELNVVEQNIIGERHGETIPVEHPYWVNFDTDNVGRLVGIELLSEGSVAAKLSAYITL